MKTKAKSVNVYEVRLWSMEHFDEKLNKKTNIFRGTITNSKTKESKFIDNAADLLTIMVKMYMEDEKNAKKLKGGSEK